MSDLLQPKTVEIETADGKKKSYVLSKIPAIAAREIVHQYPLSAMPKIGDYKVNEATMFKLISYSAAVADNGTETRLVTPALIDNHVPDWETLSRLEIGMIEYNCSFFGNGRASNFFDGIAQKLPQLISKILTDWSAQSSRTNAPPSTN